MSEADGDTVAFLVRSAREFTRGGLIFTGFHWPVLAGALAAELAPEAFEQIFEAGAVARGPAEQLPSSTTDFHALETSCQWVGSSDVVFPALLRRADRVVLDAANVDLAGRINSTAIGPYARPAVRLPGGGGAADAAYAARELVLLHGGRDPRRIVARVEHVTAAPASGALVRLLTRWGTLRLDGGAQLIEASGQPPEHFHALGIDLSAPREVEPPSVAEASAAAATLRAAAERGYAVAREAHAR